MTKEQFLIPRWNYIISLVQGLPTFAFAIYGLSTPLGDTKTGMIILSESRKFFCLAIVKDL